MIDKTPDCTAVQNFILYCILLCPKIMVQDIIIQSPCPIKISYRKTQLRQMQNTYYNFSTLQNKSMLFISWLK